MAEPVDIIFRPGPKTLQFLHDTESRVKAFLGPFGTGKTTAAAWDIIDHQSERVRARRGIKRSRYAIVRNTYPELRDTTIRTYLEWFPPLLFGKYNATNKSYMIYLKDPDREIELLFKALDSADDVRDLLSLEISGAHVDEAREVPEDIILGLLGRIGRFPPKKDFGGEEPFLTTPQLLLTSNYPDDLHWLYKCFVAAPTDGYTLYEAGQDENKHNLREGYYENLEKDYANRPDLLRTLVRGQWGVTVRGKAVYPEFSRSKHVAPTPFDVIDAPVIRGWDNSGLSPACIITQINNLGQWLIPHEFCEEDIGTTEFGEMVTMWCNSKFGSKMKYRDIGDPAGRVRGPNKKSPYIYLRKLGITVENGIQTFKVRREAVAGRLLMSRSRDLPSIYISPSCRVLTSGFEGGYAFPEIGKSGVYKTEPAKNQYSHIHDALQYPATRLFVVDKPPRESVTDIMRRYSGRY